MNHIPVYQCWVVAGSHSTPLVTKGDKGCSNSPSGSDDWEKSRLLGLWKRIQCLDFDCLWPNSLQHTSQGGEVKGDVVVITLETTKRARLQWSDELKILRWGA